VEGVQSKIHRVFACALVYVSGGGRKGGRLRKEKRKRGRSIGRMDYKGKPKSAVSEPKKKTDVRDFLLLIRWGESFDRVGVGLGGGGRGGKLPYSLIDNEDVRERAGRRGSKGTE